jgi:nitrite reductase (NADH) small subunit
MTALGRAETADDVAALAAAGWTRVGRLDDVPFLEGRSVAIGGRRIAVFRLPDGLAAVDAACPHSGGPLSDGIVADHCVTCPLHGWRFDLASGRAVNGPGAVAVHDVCERDGEVWVRLA